MCHPPTRLTVFHLPNREKLLFFFFLMPNRLHPVHHHRRYRYCNNTLVLLGHYSPHLRKGIVCVQRLTHRQFSKLHVCL